MLLYNLFLAAGVSFNFETLSFRQGSQGVQPVQDECNFPAYKMLSDSFRNTTQCRCPGYRNFSILTKFKLDKAEGAVSLLELGQRGSNPQLRVSIDNCDNKLIVYLNENGEGCGYGSSKTLEYTMPTFQAKTWNKLAVEFTETSVSVYLNCQLLSSQVKAVNRTGCLLQCTDSTLNRLVGSYPQSNCSNGGLVVSKLQELIKWAGLINFN